MHFSLFLILPFYAYFNLIYPYTYYIIFPLKGKTKHSITKFSKESHRQSKKIFCLRQLISYSARLQFISYSILLYTVFIFFFFCTVFIYFDSFEAQFCFMLGSVFLLEFYSCFLEKKEKHEEGHVSSF